VQGIRFETEYETEYLFAMWWLGDADTYVVGRISDGFDV
jgi:hypothetical protein